LAVVSLVAAGCQDVAGPGPARAPSGPAKLVSAGYSCVVPGPGYSCAGLVTFSSYYTNGPFKPFQAQAGTHSQPDITINFSQYVDRFTVWANDPDYSGNYACNYFYGGGPACAGFAADGNPGWFTASGRTVTGTSGGASMIYRVVLRSDDNDYVNWSGFTFRRRGSTVECRITGPSTSCDGVTATVSPWHQGSRFDPFQGTDNYSGYQEPIEIVFENPVYAVGVTAVDPDYSGNHMVAFDAAGSVLQTVYFAGDGVPGRYSTNTQSITSAAGIKSIRLVPDPYDYVAFQGLSLTPGY
jgi:hypothetical protein